MSDFARLSRALYEGKSEEVVTLTKQALADGFSAEEVLEEGLVRGIKVVGEDFKNNTIYVPQVLIAARSMKAGMAVLEPLLAGTTAATRRGTIVMGTVRGDLHDIGKSLVCMLSEGAGFAVVDIGVDQSADRFVAAAKEHDAGIVGASALLTTTMPYMKTIVDAFAAEGMGHVRVCVGGAAVSAEYAERIGAAGYAADASRAVELFERIYPEPSGD